MVKRVNITSEVDDGQIKGNTGKGSPKQKPPTKSGVKVSKTGSGKKTVKKGKC